MRLAAVFLLAVPGCALAQAVPHPPVAQHQPAPVTPGRQPAPEAGHQPAVTGKTTTPQPGAAKGKPDEHKHKAPAKPVRKPVVAAPRPVPAPVPAPAEPAASEPAKGSNTGLPLPRFAALRSDDVNFRSGPGTRYPIEWVYKRRDLPVEIEREFEVWRLVRDPLGNKGWVHQATLTGRRNAVVAGSERMLQQAASETAEPVAKLKVGVILRLRACDAGSEWCQAQIGDYRGFIKRSEIWGVLPGEVIQ